MSYTKSMTLRACKARGKHYFACKAAGKVSPRAEK